MKKKKSSAFTSVDINKINLPKYSTPPKNISDLKESIRSLGLLHPPTLTSDLTLIAGRHRYLACKELGYATIQVKILNVNKLTAELVQIEENLIRRVLTDLERCEQSLRRKVICLKLGLVQKRGGDRKSKKIKKQELPFDRKSFAEEVAEKTGRSVRSVNQDIQIAKDLSNEVRNLIRSTEIANRKVDLIKLARESTDRQKAIAEVIKNGTAQTFAQAKSVVDGDAVPVVPKFTEQLHSFYTWQKQLSSMSSVAKDLIKAAPKQRKRLAKRARELSEKIESLNSEIEKLKLLMSEMQKAFLRAMKPTSTRESTP